MENLLEQGVVGIVTGILTMVILYLIKVLWDAKLRPFLSEVRYQGVKVDGRWNGQSKDETHQADSNLFLTQSAHSLAGTFNFKFKNKEKDFEIDFVVNGYMWEGYLTLNFKPRDRRVTSYATTLLKLHSGGNVLLGEMVFRNVEEEKVSNVPLFLVRAPQ